MDVKVTVRSPRRVMKASPWEIEDAEHEGIPILDNHAPKEFLLEKGRLAGVRFQKMKEVGVDKNGRPKLEPSGEEVVLECDDVLMAIGQENSFPWIERNIGLEFDEWNMPKVDKTTMMSTRPGVFFGGDAAWGPENIIWAVAHGHQAALSIDLLCHGKDLDQERPTPGSDLFSQKMGIHEWSYKNDYTPLHRVAMPHADKAQSLRNLKVEVELGYDDKLAFKEAERCLNCDVQTVFSAPLCIECDACMDICPVDCINFTDNDAEPALREHLRVPARNKTQDLYVSGAAQDRPHHGQGRGRVPALRAVRRALPDGRLGHAEIHVRGGAGFPGLSDASQCLSALKEGMGSDPMATTLSPRIERCGMGSDPMTQARRIR